MKLRFRENSMRLRVLQSEVKTLSEKGFISERITFSPTQKLIYRIEFSDAENDISARFEDEKIVVRISAEKGRNWIETDSVGLEKEQRIDDENSLKIVVEKDFVCVERPFDKDNADAFPHPEIKC